MITEEQETTIRIDALNRVIKREEEFIQRQLALQRAGVGVCDAFIYDSLTADKHTHKKKKRKRKRPRRNFFTWGPITISPYQAIANARERISFLELRLGDTMNRNFPAEIILPMDLTDEIEEYRLPDDMPNTVRINSKPPVGKDLRIKENLTVVGISFKDKIDAVMNFVYGRKRSIVLVREPDNEYDSNAIAVHGVFHDDEGQHFSGHIGYIPKQYAKKWVDRDIEPQLSIIYMPTKEKGPGIRIHIWESSDLMQTLENQMLQAPEDMLNGTHAAPPPPESDF